MAALREDAAKSKAGISPADRTALCRAARFGTADGHPLLPSADALAALWRAHGRQLADEYRARPSLAHAYAVAELSDDRSLRRTATRWLEWRRAEPDPRPTAADGDDSAVERYRSWRAAEPLHLPIARRPKPQPKGPHTP